MSSTRSKLRRRLKSVSCGLRGAGKILGAFFSTDHPLLAHIIPIRRCNLACKYCNEYDDFSKPVPTETIPSWTRSSGAFGSTELSRE